MTGTILLPENTAELSGDELAALRREHFGFIFQRYHLLSHLSAEQNVEMPAIYAGLSARERRERAAALLQRLGLCERLIYRRDSSPADSSSVSVSPVP